MPIPVIVVTPILPTLIALSPICHYPRSVWQKASVNQHKSTESETYSYWSRRSGGLLRVLESSHLQSDRFALESDFFLFDVELFQRESLFAGERAHVGKICTRGWVAPRRTTRKQRGDVPVAAAAAVASEDVE